MIVYSISETNRVGSVVLDVYDGDDTANRLEMSEDGKKSMVTLPVIWKKGQVRNRDFFMQKLRVNAGRRIPRTRAL